MKKKVATILFLIPLLITGCNAPSTPTPKSDGYIKLDKSVETYYSYGKKYSGKKRYSKATGEQNVLVVPVIIKGYEANATSDNKEKIRKAFFGETNDTGFESVASYFKKSSFNNLTISGEVTDWIDINMTPKEVYDANNITYGDYGTFTVLNRVYNALKANSFDFTNYDKDEDGYIDSIYMIFSCETRIAFDTVTSDDPLNPFWAITYADIPNMNNEHSHSNPIPHMYSWSGYDVMNNGSAVSISIDAHTYIHEMGHIFGLDDYYDYDGLHSPMGCFDMQDYNVGDHNAFSKYAFGWTTPYLVQGDSEITIYPSSTTGESIIISGNSSFSNSAFDEYLMLELLTPNGLWTHDATYPYPNVGSKTYQTPGVRMIHVDARCSSDKGIVSRFDEATTVSQMCSNTPSRSYMKITSNTRSKYDLVNVIPANGLRGYQTSSTYVANDGALFKSGQVFTSGDYEFFFFNGGLHNGKSIQYRINFKEVSIEKAVIQFTVI